MQGKTYDLIPKASLDLNLAIQRRQDSGENERITCTIEIALGFENQFEAEMARANINVRCLSTAMQGDTVFFSAVNNLTSQIAWLLIDFNPEYLIRISLKNKSEIPSST